jgi:hypothetical protein
VLGFGLFLVIRRVMPLFRRVFKKCPYNEKKIKR